MTISLLLGTVGAGAGSITVLENMSEGLPSFSATGDAAKTAAPSIAAPGSESGPKRVSTSVVAIGDPVAREETVAEAPEKKKQKRRMAQSTMVIRGGISGGPAATRPEPDTPGSSTPLMAQKKDGEADSDGSEDPGPPPDGPMLGEPD
ncbi:hypothetical protein [Nitratireductor basaltis]|nr:hypothetical protein [Nitratireductor basaltis]